MYVAHELAPTQDLSHEALTAGERERLVRRHVMHQARRQQPMQVEQRGDAGVKQPAGSHRQRVFEWPEVRQACGPRPAPKRFRVGSGGGQGGCVERAGVMREAGSDKLDDLARDRVGLEEGRLRCRGLTAPWLAIFCVEAVLATNGPGALHQQPRALTNVAVKGIHSPGRALAGALVEVCRGGEPALVALHEQRAATHQRLQLDAQLALGRFHHV